jgi:hypothetical protein
MDSRSSDSLPPRQNHFRLERMWVLLSLNIALPAHLVDVLVTGQADQERSLIPSPHDVVDWASLVS